MSRRTDPTMPGMAASSGDVYRNGPDADPRVAAAVHLLHHRRIWNWILAGSLIGLAADIAASVFGSGPAGNVADVALAVFSILIVVAVIVVLADTYRLLVRYTTVRVQALQQVTHHPVAAHAVHATGYVIARLILWLLFTAWLAFAVILVPAEVNSVAYLANVGPTATFVAQSYTQQCGRSGCYNVTNGVLQTNPPFDVTWPNQVPLGSKFPVRRPVWAVLGYSHDLLTGGDSGFTIGAGLVVDFLTGAMIAGIVHETRRGRRSRRGTKPVTVTAD
jgi:hypothetical protein